MSMSYIPSKSVSIWCNEIFEIIGHVHRPDRVINEIGIEAEYEIRKANIAYLSNIRLDAVARARAEATCRNLLDGYVGSGLT